MKILAIDTSTTLCSAAIRVNDRVITRSEIAPRRHTQLILPMIDELLAEVGYSLNALDGIAFGAGPGSFTGIRLAAGVVQGLAYASDLPVLPISTLAVVAAGAYRRHKVNHVLAALDARMNQIYWGGYQVFSNGLVENRISDSVVNPENAIWPEKDQWFGAGEGWQRYASSLQAKGAMILTGIDDQLMPEAQDIAWIAERLFEAGKGLPADQALPVYLRDQVV